MNTATHTAAPIKMPVRSTGEVMVVLKRDVESYRMSGAMDAEECTMRAIEQWANDRGLTMRQAEHLFNTL